ncbi:STAS domain-containing protein [Streptomyces sp. 549]|uniref:STAS domain-containing protein n=1 Tax=Streptomyces sp. 549 TaxID=3049076 RepID=UPI0024C37061|nr:STAS domain-containing protein [Streptomyces sp. 549]MDK1472752.1 STAS domain-containing protein [Streptomyces sp. 549]
MTTFHEQVDSSEPIPASSYRRGGATVIVLAGEVDVETEPQARLALDAAVREGRRVVFDLSAVTFADSSILNLLLAARNRCELVLAGPLHSQVLRLFEVTGVSDVFTVADGVDTALTCPAEGPSDRVARP